MLCFANGKIKTKFLRKNKIRKKEIMSLSISILKMHDIYIIPFFFIVIYIVAAKGCIVSDNLLYSVHGTKLKM